ncbi:MAG: very short patch repair endonuclease [Promethearchaeota archaeon]
MDYIRDGRAPIPENENISKVMSANKGKDTKPELMLREALIEIGLTDFKTNLKDIPGRPDIAFLDKKLAIFVHGCYWHHCPKCNPNLPKSNTEFWKKKFEKNKWRDEKKKRDLWRKGWKVMVFWEHEIKKNVVKCAEKIKRKLVKIRNT